MVIFTKYVGPTDFRGSRCIASLGWGDWKKRLSLPWDPSENSEEMHKRAAIALAEREGFFGEYEAGETGSGYVFVRTRAASASASHPDGHWTHRGYAFRVGPVVK